MVYTYKKLIVLKVLFIFQVCSNCLFAQNFSDSESDQINFTRNDIFKELKTEISFPNVTVFLGVGLLPGGRVGANVRFIENFSAEVSYGNDWRNFIMLSDLENRFGVGINYHLSNLPLHVNLYYVYASRPKKNHNWIRNPRYLYSINLGYMPENKGLTPFARIGLYYETFLKNPENKIQSGAIYFNLDVGVGWTF